MSRHFHLQPLPLAGLVLIQRLPISDERGFLERLFCADTFAEIGLHKPVVQINHTLTRRKGTVRGMHFSAAPHGETKVVRCTSGAVHDVIVDLRPDSPTYLQVISCELSARNWRALYIPSYFAHGFQALADGTEVLYMIDRPFVPGTARGLRWNDPAIRVEWPEPITMIAQKDMQFSDWVR